MKSILVSILILFSRVVFAQDPMPKDVIVRYLDAIGGQDRLNSVKDLTMEVNGDVQGQSMQMTIKKKAPNKFSTIINVDGMGEVNKTIFDGKKGIVSGMGQEQKLEGETAKSLEAQSEIFGEMVYLKDPSKLTFGGKEKINDEECYIITMETAMGKSKEYYSATSGLKVRQITDAETPMGKTTITIDYSDYKAANGVLFPHTMKQDMGMFAMELKLKSLIINSGLEDSDFFVE